MTRQPWEWRKPSGGFYPGPRRIFHAHDENHHAACCEPYGLMASCEEPNEGSELCPDCIEYVRANPAGRE